MFTAIRVNKNDSSHYYAFIFGKMLWDLFPCGSRARNLRRLILFAFIALILYIVWMVILYSALILIVYGIQRPTEFVLDS